MVPIINIATRSVNGGNIMKLKGKDATSFYLTTGVLYVEISGTTKGFPKSAFAPATPPKAINYTFVREGFDPVSIKKQTENLVKTIIDRQNWLYSVRFNLPDVENGGQVIAVFSAEQLKGSFWRTVKSVGFITIISLILIAIIASFSGRQITRPIFQTTRHIRQISESLDLTDRVDISTGNEVGEMAASFNIF